MSGPYWTDGQVSLYLGKCEDILPLLPPESVDAVITDPPYDLTSGKKGGSGAASLNEAHPAGRSRITTGGGFMGQAWDATGVAFDPATWRAVMRVLKPGGYLLAFGGTRTWHRMVCAIEDAGFEIREPIADLTGIDGPGLLWIQGQGFPKNLDVSKAIDKRPGKRSAPEFAAHLKERREALGLSRADVAERVTGNRTGAVWNWENELRYPEARWWEPLRDLLGLDPAWGPVLAEAEREVVAERRGLTSTFDVGSTTPVGKRLPITAPTTGDAARWDGWGTALKPAWEPIAVARKPLTGTVAQNVLTYGTGALNIAGCLIPHAGTANLQASKAKNPGRADLFTSDTYGAGRPQQSVNDAGRWPPNVVLGETAAAEIDRQSSGGSRLFPVFKYEPKAPSHERPRLPDGTAWPTVKPLDLMRWLVRLVTPPGGTVLDPFCGTGTTAEACIVEGFSCVTIDRDETALRLALERLRKPIQPTLFGLEDTA